MSFYKKTGSRFQKSIPILGSRGDPGPNADPWSRLVMALTSREEPKVSPCRSSFFPLFSSSELLPVLNSFEFRNRSFIEFDVEIETSCVFYRNFSQIIF